MDVFLLYIILSQKNASLPTKFFYLITYVTNPLPQRFHHRLHQHNLLHPTLQQLILKPAPTHKIINKRIPHQYPLLVARFPPPYALRMGHPPLER